MRWGAAPSTRVPIARLRDLRACRLGHAVHRQTALVARRERQQSAGIGAPLPHLGDEQPRGARSRLIQA